LCEKCGKQLNVLDIEIKYSPTENLVKNPLIYCKKPMIKYNSKTISRVLKINELHKIILYLSELGFNIYSWYWNRKNKKREFKEFNKKEIKQIDEFLHLYITQKNLNIDDFVLTIDELGLYMKEDLWRKNELIEVGYVNMVNVGIIYRLEYGTQYIDKNGEVINKSIGFSDRIENFEKWIDGKYL
jgi:hypothetical protein